MSPTEEKLNEALRLLTVYMVESKTPTLKADLYSHGSFYVINITIREVVE